MTCHARVTVPTSEASLSKKHCHGPRVSPAAPPPAVSCLVSTEQPIKIKQAQKPQIFAAAVKTDARPPRSAMDALCNTYVSYFTTKYVQVRDWRLGLVYYAAVCLSVIYVLADVIILRKGFLVYEPVIGVVRLDLRGDGSALKHPSSYPYCPEARTNGSMAGRYAHSASVLPECHGVHTEARCVRMDEHDIVFPPHEESAVFITTSLLELDEEEECPDSDDIDCVGREVWRTTSCERALALGIDDEFELSIEHTLFTHASTEMDGSLMSENGSVVARLPRGVPSALKLRELLAAAGVHLDDPGGWDMGNGSATLAVRDTGIVLALMIEYSNIYTTFFPAHDPVYSIHVRRMHDASFALDEVVYHPRAGAVQASGAPRTRTVRHRSGVRVKAFQTGKIGEFSFQRLLLSIASGLVIVGTARAVVDVLALFVLQDRKRYYGYIVQETETYEQVRARRKKAEDLRAETLGAMLVRQKSSSAYARLEEGRANTPVAPPQGRQAGIRASLSRLSALVGLGGHPSFASASARRDEVMELWASLRIQRGFRAWRAYRSSLPQDGHRKPLGTSSSAHHGREALPTPSPYARAQLAASGGLHGGPGRMRSADHYHCARSDRRSPTPEAAGRGSSLSPARGRSPSKGPPGSRAPRRSGARNRSPGGGKRAHAGREQRQGAAGPHDGQAAPRNGRPPRARAQQQTGSSSTSAGHPMLPQHHSSALGADHHYYDA